MSRTIIVGIRPKIAVMSRTDGDSSCGKLGFPRLIDRGTGLLLRASTLKRRSRTENVSPGGPFSPKAETK